MMDNATYGEPLNKDSLIDRLEQCLAEVGDLDSEQRQYDFLQGFLEGVRFDVDWKKIRKECESLGEGTGFNVFAEKAKLYIEGKEDVIHE
ncbi:hypothetical protein HY627_00125 [Candidatus Uhrbacteria bacterium]|nr:hypothetical protein [Candidatus Uhrbacteria bacterium]